MWEAGGVRVRVMHLYPAGWLDFIAPYSDAPVGAGQDAKRKKAYIVLAVGK